MPLYTPPLEEFERSYCACGQCRAACKAMPGFVVPSDIPKIADFVDLDVDELLHTSFSASEGPTVGIVTPEGLMTYKVPTIVPDQMPDGSCVFLENERCMIHAVSPFGCRVFSVCDPPSEEAQMKSAAGIRACMDETYTQMAMNLVKADKIAPPLSVRRGRLVQLLKDIHATGPTDGDGPQAVPSGGSDSP